MAVPDRWADLDDLFGKHSSQLSEIFWEAVERSISQTGHLLLDPVPQSYMQQRAAKCASAIHGFVDGTAVGIARPKGHMQQLVVYNGHKRKHALKYQAVSTPDGMILHAHGQMEGRRHDWFLYLCSDVESNFCEILLIDGVQYVLYGDSGYNWFVYGSSIPREQPECRSARLQYIYVQGTYQCGMDIQGSEDVLPDCGLEAKNEALGITRWTTLPLDDVAFKPTQLHLP